MYNTALSMKYTTHYQHYNRRFLVKYKYISRGLCLMGYLLRVETMRRTSVINALCQCVPLSKRKHICVWLSELVSI